MLIQINPPGFLSAGCYRIEGVTRCSQRSNAIKSHIRGYRRAAQQFALSQTSCVTGAPITSTRAVILETGEIGLAGPTAAIVAAKPTIGTEIGIDEIKRARPGGVFDVFVNDRNLHGLTLRDIAARVAPRPKLAIQNNSEETYLVCGAGRNRTV